MEAAHRTSLEDRRLIYGQIGTQQDTLNSLAGRHNDLTAQVNRCHNEVLRTIDQRMNRVGPGEPGRVFPKVKLELPVFTGAL